MRNLACQVVPKCLSICSYTYVYTQIVENAFRSMRLTAIQIILAATREPQCSNTSYDSPTATLLRDVHNVLTHWTGQRPFASNFPTPPLSLDAQTAIKEVNVDSAVVLGHSAGGRVAVDMVTGEFLPITCSKSSVLHVHCLYTSSLESSVFNPKIICCLANGLQHSPVMECFVLLYFVFHFVLPTFDSA